MHAIQSSLKQILPAALIAAFFLAPGATPVQAQDSTTITRPDCTDCASARKKAKAAGSTIERTKKRLREEDLNDNQFRKLDKKVEQNRTVVRDAQKVFDACKNGCPASLGVKVKPIKINTCKECRKVADELAAVQTQIAQVEAEQKRLKELKRQVSLKGQTDMANQLKKLKAQREAKSKAFADCEKKFCGEKKEAGAIDKTVEGIMKQFGKDKKKKKDKKPGDN